MKVLKFLLGLIVALLAIFFLGALLLPDRVQVERSIDIDRPQSQVFVVVNDISRFNEWSPWHGLDPDVRYSYEGPTSGVGATQHWHSDGRMGEGSLWIVDVQAPERVSTQVRFGGHDEPADAIYRIQALSEDTSRVTWDFQTRLSGPSARWFGLLLPRFLGTDYENGLASLKALVEGQTLDRFDDLSVTRQDVQSMDVIAIDGQARRDDAAETAAVLGQSYGQLVAFAAEHDLEIVGQPLTLTDDDDTGAALWRFSAALPVRAEHAPPASGPIRLLGTYQGPALVIDHVGSYDRIDATLHRVAAYMAAHGHHRHGPVQQIYVSDPADTSEDELLTRIIVPLGSD